MKWPSLFLVLILTASGCVSIPHKTNTWTSTSPLSETPSSVITSKPVTWSAPFVEWNNTTVKLPFHDARLNCSGVLWRYFLKDALSCMLSRAELRVISPLAEILKGQTVEESAWNVLAWEDKWISYNWTKAKLPPPEVVWYPDGTVKIINGTKNTIQTPYETIMRRKGICTDYTVLTDALLLAMNYSPVYAMEINFTEQPGHAVALVRISGWFFVLDQHLPPMDLGAYYEHWKREGRIILNATIYQIRSGSPKANVIKLGVVSGNDFLKQNYQMSDTDAKELATAIMNILHKKFGLSIDKRLAGNGTVPKGYSREDYITFRFYNLAEYYHPFFLREYASWLLERMRGEISPYLPKTRGIWVNVAVSGNDLVVVIYIGM